MFQPFPCIKEKNMQDIPRKGYLCAIQLPKLEIAKTRSIYYRMPGTSTPEEIFDYFAGEIFEVSHGETQAFLLKTSFLSGMTPLMAEKLTGISTAEEILVTLNRNHYFTTQSRPGYPAFTSLKRDCISSGRTGKRQRHGKRR